MKQPSFLMKSTVLRRCLDFLLPPRCPLCNQRVQDHTRLCGTCFRDLNLISDPFCGRCMLPFPVPMPRDSLCGSCLAKPPSYDQAMAAALYGGAARDMILRFKHGKRFEMAPLMADLMLAALQQTIAARGLDPSDFILVPVPLHWTRLLSRRFNQSALLAKTIAARSGMAVMPRLLVRCKATQSQGKMKRKARERNLRGAFALDKTLNKTLNKTLVKSGNPDQQAALSGKILVLVDDVYTTGATAASAVKVLRKTKGSEIWVLTFAKVSKL